MRPTERFIHPRTERAWSQIALVIKHGVLGWGGTSAVVMFLIQSYQRNSWVPPREFVWSLITWGLAGIVFGLLQLGRSNRRDGARRCAECGEGLPSHTGWCAGEARHHKGAA